VACLPIFVYRVFMSTRSSIWLGESEGKSVHIYWELAHRDIEARQRIGRIAAPVYLSVDEGDAEKEISVRLPKAVAEEILRVLLPAWRECHEVL
jgi:hypothetical protein